VKFERVGLSLMVLLMLISVSCATTRGNWRSRLDKLPDFKRVLTGGTPSKFEEVTSNCDRDTVRSYFVQALQHLDRIASTNVSQKTLEYIQSVSNSDDSASDKQMLDYILCVSQQQGITYEPMVQHLQNVDIAPTVKPPSTSKKRDDGDWPVADNNGVPDGCLDLDITAQTRFSLMTSFQIAQATLTSMEFACLEEIAGFNGAAVCTAPSVTLDLCQKVLEDRTYCQSETTANLLSMNYARLENLNSYVGQENSDLVTYANTQVEQKINGQLNQIAP